MILRKASALHRISDRFGDKRDEIDIVFELSSV